MGEQTKALRIKIFKYNLLLTSSILKILYCAMKICSDVCPTAKQKPIHIHTCIPLSMEKLNHRLFRVIQFSFASLQFCFQYCFLLILAFLKIIINQSQSTFMCRDHIRQYGEMQKKQQGDRWLYVIYIIKCPVLLCLTWTLCVQSVMLYMLLHRCRFLGLKFLGNKYLDF